MEISLHLLLVTDWLTITIATIDKILFGLYFIVVLYLFIFALGSNIKRKVKYVQAKKQYNYAILFYLNSKDAAIIESVDSFLIQSYPKDKYDVIVVSNDNHTLVNERLQRHGVKVVIAKTQNYNKSTAIKEAMLALPDNLYDVVIIMNDDSLVEPDFLTSVNDAYYTGGTTIQVHRVSHKLESDTALFAAVSEEINNSIFRRGHVNLGFSSALIGSGMVFKFTWLKENVVNLRNSDIEKQLEALLLEQFVFIDYLNDVAVYSQKANKASEYYSERSTWFSNRLDNLKMMFQKLPAALAKGNFDLCNKIIQWLLPSRVILIGSLVIISFFLIIFSWGMAIKWVAILIMLIVAFSIALPDYFVDARFIKALRSAPRMFTLMVLSSVKRKLKLK